MLKSLVKSQYGIDVLEEYKFHPTRKWRFDFAIIKNNLLIAIEVEGAVWTNGRHTRGSGFVKDMEKYNTATAMGWKIIRIVPNDYASCLKYMDLILSSDKKTNNKSDN